MHSCVSGQSLLARSKSHVSESIIPGIVVVSIVEETLRFGAIGVSHIPRHVVLQDFEEKRSRGQMT